MRAWRMVALAAALIAALAAAGASSAGSPPRVSVIADSVLTAVEWNAAPRRLLEQGLDVQLDVGICRTLEGSSCPFEGVSVPTLIDLLHAPGAKVAPTVLVEVGYNDPPGEFAQRVEDSVNALLATGARRILWVNMRAWQAQYVGMNETLDEAAARHPQLTIVDWEHYSHDHYSWFQGDGIHLVYDGAMAMARFLNTEIREAITPLQLVAQALPVARVGEPYADDLVARGGRAPYRWSVTSGPLPAGLHLLARGRLVGVPRRAERVTVTVQVSDGTGRSVTRDEPLLIQPRV